MNGERAREGKPEANSGSYHQQQPGGCRPCPHDAGCARGCLWTAPAATGTGHLVREWVLGQEGWGPGQAHGGMGQQGGLDGRRAGLDAGGSGRSTGTKPQGGGRDRGGWDRGEGEQEPTRAEEAKDKLEPGQKGQREG